MPHRAGYFVLAYAWDHHCRVIYESIEGRFRQVERDVSELGRADAPGPDGLLDYYTRWHDSSERYRRAMGEIESRRFVINSLGYRGYGVNRDLLAALEDLAARYGRCDAALAERFYRRSAEAASHLSLPPGIIEERRSDVIVRELAKRAGRNPGSGPAGPEDPDLGSYFDAMSRETSWQANAAIFEKMFFSVGSSSITIMKGSTGLHDGRSCQELKLLANRNFVETGRKLFSALREFTEIGTDLLKDIHYTLSRGLDAGAGAFRTIDFPDRNGVTFEFGNFSREVGDLAIVLGQTARSFHRLDEFIYNLARSYYMFIGIHPFWDANGRAGRCFLNFLFMKKGLPPVVLDDRDEVLVLPRYGGSMEDMHRYLKGRLKKATETYFYERWKLETFGLLGKKIYHPAFDSGFRFRQIEDRPPRIEVSFEAYVCDDPGTRRVLADRCGVVLPDARLLDDMTVYCGFCGGPLTEWRHRFSLRGSFYRRELAPDPTGLRTFDIDFIVDIPAQVKDGDHFSCSVASPEGRLIFNNKGLNYSYHLAL